MEEVEHQRWYKECQYDMEEVKHQRWYKDCQYDMEEVEHQHWYKECQYDMGGSISADIKSQYDMHQLI